MRIKRKIFDNDHEMFRDSFRKFLQQEVIPNQEKWEEEGITPREIWKKCGFFGLGMGPLFSGMTPA